MTRTHTGMTLFLAVVLVFGAWYLMPSGLGPSRANYYDLLGNALSHGQLSIGNEPCLYDTIPYGGRCYLHFGIVPGLLHWWGLWSDRVGSILGAVVLTFYLLGTLFRLSGSRVGDLAVPISLFVAFGTGIFTTALCGWVYGESLCLAHAFGMMGIFYLLPVITDVGGKARPFLSGVAIALACLTRPSWFLFAGLSGMFLFRKRIFSYVVTVAGAFIVQAGINFSRFGNPFEFGVRYYQGHLVNGLDVRTTEGIYSLKALVPNFFTYFFTGLPPVPLSAPGGQVFQYLPITKYFHSNLYVDLPMALFVTMPVMYVGLFLVLRTRAALKSRGVLALLLVPMSLLLLLNTNEIYRYQFEVWLPVLILVLPELFKETRPWIAVTAWASAGVCLVLTAINTFWVVHTRWSML